ncbi:hypothetical protein DY251_08165 [Mesorhizobium denitrificans]|uniref:Transposase IS116/IS110/IS902 C-terminal domain-containing protein n=2 Tax=Mesorhizobium denitrificans TaxID=2294114 RepID=A0A371XG78_9HYPH|nr:hypothetical protein DY251_08165 [Mesorhizobium denitrificans]
MQFAAAGHWWLVEQSRCGRQDAADWPGSRQRLTPRQFQSGETNFMGTISRRGDPATRRVLVSKTSFWRAGANRRRNDIAFSPSLEKARHHKINGLA